MDINKKKKHLNFFPQLLKNRCESYLMTLTIQVFNINNLTIFVYYILQKTFLLKFFTAIESLTFNILRQVKTFKN